MRVRVVRKLADWVDGIDLSHCSAGDLVDLAQPQAHIIIAEGWAVFARRAGDLVASTDSGEPHVSASAVGRRLLGDRRRVSRMNDLYQRLRDTREAIDSGASSPPSTGYGYGRTLHGSRGVVVA